MSRRIGKHQDILDEQTPFEEGNSAKPGPGSLIGAVGRCKVEGKAIHSFNICPKAPHGSQIQCCNMREELTGKHQIILEEQTSFEEGQSAKPGSGGQTYMFTPVKRRGRPSIPSIYAPRLLMGPKYNVETWVEELGSTKTYWRSKCLSKTTRKVPNLAQTAKLEPFAPVKRR